MNANTVAAMVQADVPVNLVSDPGEGKTQWIIGLAKALGLPCHVEILSQCDPTDIGGWPREDGGIIIRKPLAWLDRLCKAPGMLFLDEHSLAPRAVVASALRLVNERAAGDATLHEGTRIILAMNPSRFTGVELLPQVANRMAHVDFEQVVPLSAWCEGMLAGFPQPVISKLPDQWDAMIPKHRALVSAFVQRMATEAFRRPKETQSMSAAWPSRRTWDLSTRVSAACESIGEDDALAIGALVGEGPALSFVSWRAAQDLPNPQDALADPEKFPLPTEDDRMYILLTGAAALAIGAKDAKQWKAAWKLIGRACKMKKADVAVIAGKTLVKAIPKGANIAEDAKDAQELMPILSAAGAI